MALPLIPIILIGLGAAALTALWTHVCGWFADHANPWLKRHVPLLQPYVERAFQYIDAKVATPLRRMAIEAWRKLRPHLLQAVVDFERRFDGTYIRRMTSFLRSKLEDGEVVRRVEEAVVDWSELPEDVRQRILESQKAPKIDFTRARDQEMQAMEAAL